MEQRICLLSKPEQRLQLHSLRLDHPWTEDHCQTRREIQPRKTSLDHSSHLDKPWKKILGDQVLANKEIWCLVSEQSQMQRVRSRRRLCTHWVLELHVSKCAIDRLLLSWMLVRIKRNRYRQRKLSPIQLLCFSQRPVVKYKSWIFREYINISAISHKVKEEYVSTFIALCFSSSMRKAAVPSFAFPFAFVDPLFAEIVSISKEEAVSKLKQDQD